MPSARSLVDTGGTRIALRLLPWAWPVYTAKGTLAAVRGELSDRQRTRLTNLLRKSIPLGARLSARERRELLTLLGKISPLRWARYVAAEVSPLPWPGAPTARTRG